MYHRQTVNHVGFLGIRPFQFQPKNLSLVLLGISSRHEWIGSEFGVRTGCFGYAAATGPYRSRSGPAQIRRKSNLSWISIRQWTHTRYRAENKEFKVLYNPQYTITFTKCLLFWNKTFTLYLSPELSLETVKKYFFLFYYFWERNLPFFLLQSENLIKTELRYPVQR